MAPPGRDLSARICAFGRILVGVFAAHTCAWSFFLRKQFNSRLNSRLKTYPLTPPWDWRTSWQVRLHQNEIVTHSPPYMLRIIFKSGDERSAMKHVVCLHWYATAFVVSTPALSDLFSCLQANVFTVRHHRERGANERCVRERGMQDICMCERETCEKGV